MFIAIILLAITVGKLKKKEFQDLGICKIYAYSSEKKQTDNTPEITSTGKKCRKGYAACSRDWFKKGIKYGDRIYIPDLNLYLEIQDTMNVRHSRTFDIWMKKRKDAEKFGVKKLKVFKIKKKT